MAKYEDNTDKQKIYEWLSYVRRETDLSMSEFTKVTMKVIADMTASGYDYYGEINNN